MSHPTNDHMHDLAAAYALDALEADERDRFETHLATCEHCAADVAEFRETAGLLAQGEHTAPPPDVRARVMAAIADEPRQAPVAARVQTPQPQRSRSLPLAVAAALVFVVMAAGAAVFLRDAVDDRNTAEDLVAVLAAPDARSVVLEGSEGRSDLRVVWSPDTTGVVLVGDELPAPPDDQVYELWSLSADGPRSAGQFVPSGDGAIRSRLDLPAEPVDGWGVTIEPAGGSPQPTGDILYLGA